jgi:F-type H+-transporting ATPase subunit b
LAKADASVQAKLAKAEEKIRASRAEALANIEGIATELSQEIAGKVAGLKINRDDAAKAVKAELING